MEMLVTLFIIALLSSILLYGVSGFVRSSRTNLCRAEMAHIASAVQAYYISINDVEPDYKVDFDADMVQYGLLKKDGTIDPWGQEYKVLYQGLGGGKTLISQVVLEINKATSIYSSGPDKVWDNKDDVEYVFIIDAGG